MTKWIDNIDSPVVWAVMVENDGQLQMCRAGSHPMIYVSGAMARAQIRRLKKRRLRAAFEDCLLHCRFRNFKLEGLMLQTRIYPVTGFHVDVQESYDEVKKLLAEPERDEFVTLTLSGGEPVSFQRSKIVYFAKY